MAGDRARGLRRKSEACSKARRTAENWPGSLSDEGTVPTSCPGLCWGVNELAWTGGGHSARYTVSA